MTMLYKSLKTPIPFFYIIIAFTIIFNGCSSQKEMVVSDKNNDQQMSNSEIAYDETFNPLTLNDPPFEIPRRIKNKENSPELRNKLIQPDITPLDTSLVTVPGYQVQLLQTENGQEARERRKTAIIELDVDVEIEYEAPYYKVRAGKFLNRYDAELLQNLTNTKGYGNSWVVRTSIKIRAHEFSNRR